MRPGAPGRRDHDHGAQVRDERGRISMRNPARSLSLLAAIVAVAVLTAGWGAPSAARAARSTAWRAGPPRAAPGPPPHRPRPHRPRPSPPTTVAPTTVAPTTVAPTSAPATSASAASPSASATPGADRYHYLWLWILIAVVVVLIGLIVWITRSARRRSAAAAGWRSGSSTRTPRDRPCMTP